jgi:hypothetical protein
MVAFLDRLRLRSGVSADERLLLAVLSTLDRPLLRARFGTGMLAPRERLGGGSHVLNLVGVAGLRLRQSREGRRLLYPLVDVQK